MSNLTFYYDDILLKVKKRIQDTDGSYITVHNTAMRAMKTGNLLFDDGRLHKLCKTNMVVLKKRLQTNNTKGTPSFKSMIQKTK